MVRVKGTATLEGWGWHAQANAELRGFAGDSLNW